MSYYFFQLSAAEKLQYMRAQNENKLESINEAIKNSNTSNTSDTSDTLSSNTSAEAVSDEILNLRLQQPSALLLEEIKLSLPQQPSPLVEEELDELKSIIAEDDMTPKFQGSAGTGASFSITFKC